MKPRPVLISVPGTGEPGTGNGFPNGMLWGVADELNRISRGAFDFWTVDYPKTYGNPMSYADSRAAGEAALHQLLGRAAREGRRAYVDGYSQGAVIAGNAALRYRSNGVLGGVYLLADALRPEGADSAGEGSAWARANLNGSGVAGRRPIPGRAYPVRWYTIRGDVIADAFPDSLVRTIADLTEFMGFRSLADMQRWATRVADRLRAQAWQNLAIWQRWIANPRAIGWMPELVARSLQEITGYPAVHTSYGAARFPGQPRSYVQQIAWDIHHDHTR